MSSHSEHPAPPTVAFLEAQRPASQDSSDVVDWVMVTPDQDPARLFTLPLLLFVLGGSMVLAAHAAHASLAVLGALLITTAPVGALLRFVRSLHGDAYVAIRKDGLAIRVDVRAPERVLAWHSIDDVTYCEAQGEVFLHVDGKEEVLRGPFELGARELTLRIRNARRLAVWNRLTRRALEPWC